MQASKEKEVQGEAITSLIGELRTVGDEGLVPELWIYLELIADVVIEFVCIIAH
jgi:hypothetical protein